MQTAIGDGNGLAGAWIDEPPRVAGLLVDGDGSLQSDRQVAVAQLSAQAGQAIRGDSAVELGLVGGQEQKADTLCASAFAKQAGAHDRAHDRPEVLLLSRGVQELFHPEPLQPAFEHAAKHPRVERRLRVCTHRQDADLIATQIEAEPRPAGYVIHLGDLHAWRVRIHQDATLRQAAVQRVGTCQEAHVKPA